MNYKMNTQVRLNYDVPEDALLGWHFIKDNRQLRYGDNRLVVAGETLTIKGVPEVGSHGLHAAMHLDTAYHYRPNGCNTPCFVWVRGQIDHTLDGLLCGQERNCIAMSDYETFARLYWNYQTLETLAHNSMYRGELTASEHTRRRWELMEQFEMSMLIAMKVMEE